MIVFCLIAVCWHQAERFTSEFYATTLLPGKCYTSLQYRSYVRDQVSHCPKFIEIMSVQMEVLYVS